MGEAGYKVRVRIVQGGLKAAQDDFAYLSLAGKPYTGPYSRSGKLVALPGGVGWVGIRTDNDGIPTVDVNLPGVSGLESVRFHYVDEAEDETPQ